MAFDSSSPLAESQRRTQRPRRQCGWRVEAQRQDLDDPPEWQQRVRQAVPIFSPPDIKSDRDGGSEPPLPPPPPPPERGSGGRGRVFTVLVTLLLSFGWWKYYQSLMPEIRKDEYGISYVTTKAGNQVAVAEDPSGRTFFIDQAGNLYYDTGDKDIGAYVVDKDQHVFNVWIDKQEQPQRKYVGDLSDMRTMDVRSLAGIPVRELQRESRGRFDGKFTVFDSDRKARPLPPNAPVLKDEDGTVEGPPMLEEGLIQTK
ncbi:hypothetical protein WJX73_000228 [Symbiochloris irregularis]|uniref:Uncharacterized protein n=1 Tax=Symbiochloris irregularis TaxID=706552 RepID=A0AAW1NWH8_9CHLO